MKCVASVGEKRNRTSHAANAACRRTSMSSFIPELSQQLRLVLESSPNALSLPDLTLLVDEVVHECTSSSEPELLILDLEEELQAIYHDVIDHDVFEQTETFLSVLSRLTPVFSSTSLISTWFELVLRPALRQPKLPSSAVACAKDLVVTALEKPDENNPEKQGEFRRRMLDLYLLDAFNEASGDDVLEWAKWPQEQREQRNMWKSNLEDVLVRFGLGMPQVSTCHSLGMCLLVGLTLRTRIRNS